MGTSIIQTSPNLQVYQEGNLNAQVESSTTCKDRLCSSMATKIVNYAPSATKVYNVLCGMGFMVWYACAVYFGPACGMDVALR
jgi:hypothetical protein